MKKAFIALIITETLFGESVSKITVESQTVKEKTSSDQYVTQEEIEKSISANGDIGSLLQINPNVTVEDNRNNYDSVEPVKIEINGGKYYQNSFMLDGLSNDSLLDPSSTNSKYDVSGNENDLFIDLELIESVNVYDSGISAEYGEFSGGVIDVKTKRATGSPYGKIYYKYTDTSLANFHIKREDKYQEAKKPSFEKKFFNGTYSTPIDDESGMIFSYSSKYGKSPQSYLGGIKNLSNQSKNIFTKYSRYLDDDGIIDVTLNYSPYSKEGITGTYIKDGEYTIEGGGLSLKGNYEKFFDQWTMNSSFAFKNTQNTRSTKTDYLKYWKKSNQTPWGKEPSESSGVPLAVEGSWGDLKKSQRSFLGKIQFKKSLDYQKIKTGIDLKQIQGTYHRKSDLTIYRDPTYAKGIKCNGYTQDCIEGDQYFSRKDIYQKEKLSVTMGHIGGYAEDNIAIRNFNIIGGIRGDYNTYLKNFDIAPRLNTEGKFFKGKTKIFGGINRYYGKSFLAFKLREARIPYRSEYRSSSGGELNAIGLPADNNPSIWSTSADKDSEKYVYSDLNTPYTDEKVLGISQILYNHVIKSKVVYREGRDQFMAEKGKRKSFTRPDGNVVYYAPIVTNNNGESSTDVFSITIRNLEKISLLNSQFTYILSYRDMNKKSNFLSYETSEDEVYYGHYNEETYKRVDIEDGKTPPSYSFAINAETNDFSLGWLKGSLNSSLFFTFKESYTRRTTDKQTVDVVVDKVNESAYIYFDETLDEQYTLDGKFAFNTKFKNKEQLTLLLEVYNLLDEVESDIKDSYQLGRQLYVGAVYKF
ncbi:MAG: TonB-dependent receptor plug domain-containing protein [Campylobacterales bacterium]|nr:TonB-dependent receptor plug domain-containing protein [Campylobacterales bacterium]